MRVLGISGGLRRGSHNTALLRRAGVLIEAEGADFAIYYTWREVPIYYEDLDVFVRTASQAWRCQSTSHRWSATQASTSGHCGTETLSA